MFELLQKQIGSQLSLSENRGLFFSLFDTSGKLLCSKGVLETDKTLQALIDTLYHGLLATFESQTKTIVIDLIESITPQPNPQQLMTLDITKMGICLVEQGTNKQAVLLPNTEGVADMKNALFVLKQKHGLTGSVNVWSFTTQRTVVTK